MRPSPPRQPEVLLLTGCTPDPEPQRVAALPQDGLPLDVDAAALDPRPCG